MLTPDEIRRAWGKTLYAGPLRPLSRRVRLRRWTREKRHALACWISPYDD